MGSTRQLKWIAAAALAALVGTDTASASILFMFTGADGLSAEAEFTVSGAQELTIRLKNTSTGVPAGFSHADQLLTGLSWDFGDPGFNGDNMITGGTVFTGSTSASRNFDIQNVSSNTDVSGEWGYGNTDGTGALTNFFSGNTAHATPFGGTNLDGSTDINGPQAGLSANPLIVVLSRLVRIRCCIHRGRHARGEGWQANCTICRR